MTAAGPQLAFHSIAVKCFHQITSQRLGGFFSCETTRRRAADGNGRQRARDAGLSAVMRAAGWRGAGFLFLPGAGGVRGFQRCCAGWVAQRSKKKYKNAPESYLSKNIFFFLGSQQNPSDEQVTEAKPESSVLPLCHKPYTYHQLWPEVMFLAHITPKKQRATQIFRCKPAEGNPLRAELLMGCSQRISDGCKRRNNSPNCCKMN